MNEKIRFFDNECFDYFNMIDFSDIFRNKQLTDDPQGYEMLLRNFMIGDAWRTLQFNHFQYFEDTCRTLVEMGWYSPILQFMFGVFRQGVIYDLKKLKRIMEKFKIPGGDTLAKMCADFYIMVMMKDEMEYQDDGISIEVPSFEDIYNGEAERYFDLSSIPSITYEMAEFTAECILGTTIDAQDITREDVDRVAKRAKEIMDFQPKNRESAFCEENHNREDFEGKYNVLWLENSSTDKKVSEFEKDIVVPSMLVALFIAAERRAADTQYLDVCYYIQAKYLWPIMKTVPWYREKDIKVQFVSILLRSFITFICSLESANIDIYFRENIGPKYNEKTFLNEILGEHGDLTKHGMELEQKYGLGMLMAEVFNAGKNIIKQSVSENDYSFIMAFTPYLLYCGGHTQEAVAFLIRNYDEISIADKRKLYVQWTMAKAILACKKPEQANILYGRFNYELDLPERDKKSLIYFCETMVEYIKSVRDYLGKNNMRAYAKMIFGDNRIMNCVKQAEVGIARTNDTQMAWTELIKLLPYSLVYKLHACVNALSYSSEISLRPLGIKCEGHNDKLRGVLPKKMSDMGQDIVKQKEIFITFYQIANQMDIRRNINVFLQRHLYKLMDETIKESMEKIRTLRKAYISMTDENNVYEEKTADSNCKTLEFEMDEVIKELTERLESQYVGRDDVIREIDGLQKQFIKTYDLEIPGENMLISLLSDKEKGREIMNYLVTSGIVFKLLSERKDTMLDFSPALIPMTKALEMILNLVFHKMPFDKSTLNKGDFKNNKDDKGNNGFNNFKKSYFDNHGKVKKGSIELGTSISLLKDNHSINIIEEEKNYILTWAGNSFIENGSRFYRLKGNEVIRFERLEVFAGKSSLTIEPSDYEISNHHLEKRDYHLFFNKKKEYNRMLFIKGLEYVKNNYRNVAAHKDGVSLQTVENCRKIMLQSENLLWMLLYIIDI